MIGLEELEKEQLEENEVVETNEATEITEYNEVTEIAKESIISTDVPGYEGVEMTVTGNPLEVAEDLDWKQGDAVEGALGTCGLTSIANICTLAGMDVTEEDVVEYAIENNLCTVDYTSSGSTGGITGEQGVEVLESFGVECHLESVVDFGVEEVAEAVENGQGVMVSVDAGALWDDASHTQHTIGYSSETHSITVMSVANHYVTVTGVVRDADGEVAGFYICDSGRGEESDAARYLSVKEFSEAYNGSVYSADAIVTDKSIREV